ncbi:MAG TPA: MoaD/ThiS family protein [Gemmataceae bacterium]|nr:MoaD/ThiS family protein [Gemmataceae bacterium]
MKVAIKYLAQVKQAAGCASEILDIEGHCRLQELVRRLADGHGEALRRLLLRPAGELHDSILLFVGEEQVRWETPRELHDGDVVTVLAPMAGG